MSESAYRAIASRSAELNAVQQAIDAGLDLGGGEIATALVGPYAEDLGFPKLSILAWIRGFFASSE